MESLPLIDPEVLQQKMMYVANIELDRFIKTGIQDNDDNRSFKAIADVVLNVQKSERETAKLLKDLGLTDEELQEIADE